MLNRIKHYFTLDCVIFTIMTVVLSIVFYFTTWDNTVNKITTEEFFQNLWNNGIQLLYSYNCYVIFVYDFRETNKRKWIYRSSNINGNCTFLRIWNWWWSV